LSATGQDKFHKNFGPFTEGFVHIPANDFEALDKALDEKTVAGFFIEAIQGESGIVPQADEYIAFAAELCAQRDILLMFDEIQCGIGRTGTFLALEQFKNKDGSSIKADIVTLAKGLAGGIPAGAVLAGEKTCDVFKTGDHGSTFGGNPIAAAAGLVVLKTVNDPEFMNNIVNKGEIIVNGLRKHNKVKEVRGKGLMIGFDIESDALPVIEAGIARADNVKNQNGLLLLSAGQKTLRLLPSYTILESEIDHGLEILSELLDK
jgi:acetylornithine/N-succinyldiaminopimelate aminotransferase